MLALVLVACWILAPVLLIPWVPGILLFATPLAGRLDRASLAVHAVGVSLVFWMASFWLTGAQGLPLALWFRGASLAAIAAFLWLHRRRGRVAAPVRPAHALAALGACLAVLALRAAPLALTLAPAGADMSMHGYVTELIVRADGVPDSMQPILPVDRFASFPVGFHALAALVGLTTDLPSMRSTFVLSAASHALLSFALFALLRAHAGVPASLLSAFVFSFAVKSPQDMIQWGGNPTVLAIGFAALLASALDRFRERDAFAVLLAGSALAGVLLVHTIVFAQTLYVLCLPFAVRELCARPFAWRRLLAGAAVGAFAAGLCAPYLSGVDPDVASPAAMEWIRRWVREADHAWHGSLANAAWTIPDYVAHRLGERVLGYLPFVALGIASLARRDRPALGFHLGAGGASLLLVLNCQYWVLPLSFLLYPERSVAMLVIPLAVCFACGAERLAQLVAARGALPRARRRALAAAALAAVALLAAMLGPGLRSYYLRHHVRAAVRESPVTAADLRAIEWLAAHSAPGDIVATNYGDAGLWIPAIAFRRVTEPHVNVVFLADQEPVRETPFAFVGAKCVYACPLDAARLAADPGWTLCHRDGGAHVFGRGSCGAGAVGGPAPPRD